MAHLLRPNCLAISGCAMEILLRSMYVIRYMKLMRTSTSQRVPVGLVAEFSTVTALWKRTCDSCPAFLPLTVIQSNGNEK